MKIMQKLRRGTYFVIADKSNLGVRFLINKKWKEQIKEFKPISPRLALLKLEINDNLLVIFQIHAPTSECANSEAEDFYDLVRFELSITENKNNKTLLIGDFNTSIGKLVRGEDSIRGDSSFGKRNKGGSMLMDFAGSVQMKIVNSYYTKSEEEKWTWLSPKNETYELDYILTKNIEIVKNFYIVNNLKFDTDHRMIVTDLKLDKKRPYNNLTQKCHF